MSTQGNGGTYSKFQQRLRRIRLFRIFTNKKKLAQTNDEFIKEVITNIKSTAGDRKYPKLPKGVNSIAHTISKEKTLINNKTIKEEETLEQKVLYIRENKPKVRKNKKVGYMPNIEKNKINSIPNNKKQELLNNLGADIIDKIKTSFEDKLDGLEVLESELYLVSLKQENNIELNKVKEIKVKINELIIKINTIIEQYNLYKRNYYLDNIVGIDDTIIVDDIINYRYLLDSLNLEKQFVKEYKALEEFNTLYDKLQEIKTETEKIQQDNEEKIEEYQIRDKKYDNIKLNMIPIEDINKNCSLEIEKQNEYFAQLLDKINVINRQEYITTHMKGIGELIGQSLKYMGLMLLSPLIGLIPGIAIQTLATKRMIGNIYQNLHSEEIRHIRYEAIDYDSELNHHLNDVNYTENLIYDTLKDVERLKEDFMTIYNSNISGYEETLEKIEKIENKLLRNQNKVNIVKRNLKNSKKLNDDKLILVKRMNDEQR